MEVEYTQPRIGISFEIKAAALVVQDLSEDYDAALRRPRPGSKLVGLNGTSVVDVGAEDVMAMLRGAPRPLRLEFLCKFAV